MKKRISTGEWIYFIIATLLALITLIMIYTNETITFLNYLGLNIAQKYAVFTSFIVGIIIESHFLVVLMRFLYKKNII